MSVLYSPSYIPLIWLLSRLGYADMPWMMIGNEPLARTSGPLNLLLSFQDQGQHKSTGTHKLGHGTRLLRHKLGNQQIGSWPSLSGVRSKRPSKWVMTKIGRTLGSLSEEVSGRSEISSWQRGQTADFNTNVFIYIRNDTFIFMWGRISQHLFLIDDTNNFLTATRV